MVIVTGDAYVMDMDGYFIYQARTDDMIISAGYNIAGPEVEGALLSHAAVAECGVVGQPDDERGMVVKAFVVLRPDNKPDDEMKKIVLKVVLQCCATDGVEPEYIRNEILPNFFRHFWNYRMAIDRRNYRQLVDTTIELANKVCLKRVIG